MRSGGNMPPYSKLRDSIVGLRAAGVRTVRISACARAVASVLPVGQRCVALCLQVAPPNDPQPRSELQAASAVAGPRGAGSRRSPLAEGARNLIVQRLGEIGD